MGQIDSAHSEKATPKNGIKMEPNLSNDNISHPIRKTVPKQDTTFWNNGKTEKYPYPSREDSLKESEHKINK